MKSNGHKSSINFEEVHQENMNITDQLAFTHDEKLEMKGDALEY